jgi:5'-nucleotidase
MNILVVNDDGINAPWLQLLTKAASYFGRVFVAAPALGQSAKSHAITVRGNIEVIEHEPFLGAVRTVSINGTPADCVRAALKIFDVEMDLVLSGINYGPNLATDILYSGTVAAALEAAISKVPAIALSAAAMSDIPYLYDETVKILDEIIEHQLYLKAQVLNINFPHSSFKKPLGVKLAVQGKRIQHHNYIKTDKPEVYRLGYSEINFQEEENSDIRLHREGYITITPLKVDRTDYESLKSIWQTRE